MIHLNINWPELAVFFACVLALIWLFKVKCWHKWQRTTTIQQVDTGGTTVGHKFVMRCDKCGWQKVVKS